MSLLFLSTRFRRSPIPILPPRCLIINPFFFRSSFFFYSSTARFPNSSNFFFHFHFFRTVLALFPNSHALLFTTFFHSHFYHDDFGIRLRSRFVFISHQKGSFTEPNRPSSTFARFSVLFIVPLQFISIFFSCVTREGGFAWHATILFDVFFSLPRSGFPAGTLFQLLILHLVFGALHYRGIPFLYECFLLVTEFHFDYIAFLHSSFTISVVVPTPISFL